MDREDVKAVVRYAAVIAVAFVISPLLGWIVVLMLGADIGWAVYKHRKGGSDE